VDFAEPEPVVRCAHVPGRWFGEPALPSAAGVRVHDFRQVGYLEHDWVATAGDWVYEAPGEAHTLVAYESPEPMKVTFNVTGPLLWLDEDGQVTGRFDVFDCIALCKEHYQKAGLGADLIEQLFR